MRRFTSLAPVLASSLIAACAAAPGATSSAPSVVELGPPTVPLPVGFHEAQMTLDGAGDFPRIQWAIRSRLDRVAACFAEARRLDPGLSGDLALAFTLTPQGNVAEVKTTASALADAPATTCALAVWADVALAPGPRGVAYTLRIDPQRDAQPLTAEELARVASGDLDVLGAPSLDLDALGGELRRCLAGTEAEQVWVVAHVVRGRVEIDARPPGGASDTTARDARYCVVSKLRRLPTRDDGLIVSFAGDVDPREPQKAELGMIGVLRSGSDDASAPTAPWGRDDSLGNEAARGNMWGDEIGDSFGAGGLGLVGIGEGGGGRGEGIGLGSIGTIGHGSGTGTGQGFGTGHGRLGGAHRTKPPTVRMGKTSVSGRLPPEIIQRIVRQNFGRFRICYENVLRKDPGAAGKATTTFTIDRDGSVKDVKTTSDFKDTSINGCVRKVFLALSFPQPEGGVVKVTYPVAFSPGDGAPTPAPSKAAPPAAPVAPAPMKIAGATFAELQPAALVRALGQSNVEARTVAGARELIVLARSPDHDVAVIRRVPAAEKGDCAVVDGDVAIRVDTTPMQCGYFIGALDVGR